MLLNLLFPLGGLGQLGTAAARLLRSNYGKENVILSDIIKPSEQVIEEGPYIFADILDFKGLQKAVVTHRIDWIIHFSALLSAIGEQNVSLAVRVNIEGMHNVVELAKQVCSFLNFSLFFLLIMKFKLKHLFLVQTKSFCSIHDWSIWTCK